MMITIFGLVSDGLFEQFSKGDSARALAAVVDFLMNCLLVKFDFIASIPVNLLKSTGTLPFVIGFSQFAFLTKDATPEPNACFNPCKSVYSASAFYYDFYHNPNNFHHNPPMPTHITIFTTLIKNPSFHQVPIST